MTKVIATRQINGKLLGVLDEPCRRRETKLKVLVSDRVRQARVIVDGALPIVELQTNGKQAG